MKCSVVVQLQLAGVVVIAAAEAAEAAEMLRVVGLVFQAATPSAQPAADPVRAKGTRLPALGPPPPLEFC
jgi:hypothetical protein